jgi:hypothetical protein
VPLLPSHPLPEQQYMLSNAGASLLLHDAENEARAKDLVRGLPQGHCKLHDLQRSANPVDSRVHCPGSQRMGELKGDRRAMMLYTSGTVRLESNCTGSWLGTVADELV